MKLYFYPGACSLSPHIVLREAGLEFDLERVDLASKTTARGEDFLAVNPKGYVPALMLDDGTLLTEGPAIVQYLADLQPGAGLAPATGSRKRYEMLEWLNFISAELHKQYSPLFNQQTSDVQRRAALNVLNRRYPVVAEHLAHRKYLLGDAFSVADAYLFTINSWATLVQFDLSPWPAIASYQARIAEREAVQQALRAEGLLS